MRATALMAAAGGIAATAAASNNTASAATGNALSMPVKAAAPAPERAALHQTPAATPQLDLVYAKRFVAAQPKPVQEPVVKTTRTVERPQVSRSTVRPAAVKVKATSTTRHTSASTSGSGSTSGSASGSGSATTSAPSSSNIVSIAQRYIGTPYVYGGNSPSGFDCSGLTQYVYAQAGISIPRTASAQVSSMRHTSNPQPGDLVYFGSPAHHIGIYVGNNKMIAAPYPGQNVRLQTIWDTPTGYLTH